ncbi:type VI secretion system-associated protein TagO [Brucella sp. H1_1004]|uniref:type VI secretion system-associated protein TagO n=1 Tax=Brucella sp. H1_1004 TaxID=3110109 RepID=UPI0039B4A238
MIKQGLIAVGATLLVFGAAHAQTTPQECSAIGDSLQRLTCFDKIFPKGENPAQDDSAAKESAASNWDISEDRSPIDDSLRIAAFLLPRDAEKQMRILGGPSLLLRCRDNTTSVIYTTGRFSANDRIKITYRISDTAPKTETWGSSTDRQAIGLWDGAKAVPFLKLLKNGETLAIQTENPNTEAVFDLGNVEEVVNKISDACNWK